jgi:hypothetical protein
MVICSGESIAMPPGEMFTHAQVYLVSTKYALHVAKIVPEIGSLWDFLRFPNNSNSRRAYRTKPPAGISVRAL